MNTEKKVATGSTLVETLKRFIPDAAAVLMLLLIAFFYFKGPLIEGKTLSGHDIDASVGLAQDVVNYNQASDEASRWTNSLFSGMPTFQISPSYESTKVLNTIADVYGLGTEGVVAYVFLYLLGFYILMRAFNFRVWLASLGAVVWAFSSYFFIIIAAGHIWKVVTLAFIPPTIAGMVLCYRGKLLWGSVVMALFTALQILSNHVQMSYYFFFVMLCIAVAYGVAALCKHTDAEGNVYTLKHWLKASAVILVAGIIGLLANLPNLYHTYQYSKESMRGKSELAATTPTTDGTTAPSDGLSFDYITGWSYGIDETLTLLIPDYKGGGSGEIIIDTDAAENHPNFLPMSQHLASAIGMREPLCIRSYWGEQPMTVGPVYVGAIVCFLFVLGLFVVRGPMKWAMLVATIISLVFAWGRNIPEVTHFLIDNLPMYNKFRTVSSALVIAEFTMPLLAMLALAEVLRNRDFLKQKRNKIAAIVALVATAGTCLLFWLAPDMAGNCISTQERAMFTQLAPYQPYLAVNLTEFETTLTALRHAVLSDSAARSLWFIIAAAFLLWIYTRVRSIKAWMVCMVLCVMCLTDMWQENKRYLNDDNFSMPDHREQIATLTPADQLILKDTDPHYRVYDEAGFSGNRTGYYHKSIGGYHAAKLRRYQDLIDRHIGRETSVLVNTIDATVAALERDTAWQASLNAPSRQALYTHAATIATSDSTLHLPVLNMLNTKYAILEHGTIAVENKRANGHAWFINQLEFVAGAEAEISRLGEIDTHHAAVADEAFRTQLEGTPLGEGTVELTHYAPNEIHYVAETAQGGVLVFPEVYYPGWKATIDGEEVELGRVNYILRAVRVPAGKHEVILSFHPQSITTTEAIAYASIILVMLLFAWACYKNLRNKKQA